MTIRSKIYPGDRAKIVCLAALLIPLRQMYTLLTIYSPLLLLLHLTVYIIVYCLIFQQAIERFLETWYYSFALAFNFRKIVLKHVLIS